MGQEASAEKRSVNVQSTSAKVAGRSNPFMTTSEFLSSPMREEHEMHVRRNMEILVGSDQHSKRNTAAFRNDAECAMVPVALNPEIDEATTQTQTINLFVKRFRATKGRDASKALWLVQGGPGGANDLFEPYVNALVETTKGQFDIYMVEHRGVGRSTRAGCDGAQSETPGSDGGVFITYGEWKDCYNSFKKEWGYGQSQYLNSKAAAMDLTKMITKINVPLGQSVYVYGVSYGTLLTSRLMRYLELTGRQNMLKAVVLDGIVNCHGTYGNDFLTFDNFDQGFTFVAQQLLQICGDVKRARGDDTCLKHLGESVKSPTYLLDFLKKLYSSPSPCPDYTKLFTLYQTKRVFGFFLSSDSTRHFLPAMVHRINRCDPQIDVPIFQNTYEKIYGAKQSSATEYSPLMDSDHTKMNIAHSELWDPSVTIETLNDRLENSVATMGSTHDFFTIYNITNWDYYTVDPQYFNQTFTTSIPILLLNGDLDPQTPLPFSESLNKNIKGNSKGGLILVEFAPHATMMNSAQSGSPYPCGMELLANFITMENPDIEKMDKSCLSRLTFSFKGQKASNLQLMGTEDIYDGSLPVPTPEKSALAEESTIKKGEQSVVTMSKVGFGVMIGVLGLAIIVLGLILVFVCVKGMLKKEEKPILNETIKQPLNQRLH